MLLTFLKRRTEVLILLQCYIWSYFYLFVYVPMKPLYLRNVKLFKLSFSSSDITPICDFFFFVVDVVNLKGTESCMCLLSSFGIDYDCYVKRITIFKSNLLSQASISSSEGYVQMRYKSDLGSTARLYRLCTNISVYNIQYLHFICILFWQSGIIFVSLFLSTVIGRLLFIDRLFVILLQFTNVRLHGIFLCYLSTST